MRRALRVLKFAGALVSGIAILGGGLLAWAVLSRKPLSSIPSTTHASIPRQACIDCHAPIAEEWRQSYHFKSLTGPYWSDVRRLGYLKLFEKTRKACVNCHAPANVLDLAGEARSAAADGDEPGVECTPNLFREPHGTIPAARSDDVELGVDCTSCHVSRRGVVGAGRRPTTAHETITDPRFRDSFRTADTLCRTCHRVTVEAWKRTSLVGAGITCLDCHMPSIRAASVAGGPERPRRSHRFFGDKDESMLAKALDASLTVTPDRRARLRITNDRVGHDFPSGGNWVSVRFKASDASGRTLREEMKAFGKDEAVVLDFWPFNIDNRIAFGERRDFFFALPERHGTVEAVVRYHDWMRTKRIIATLRQEY